MKNLPVWFVALAIITFAIVLGFAIGLFSTPVAISFPKARKYTTDTPIRYCVDGHEFIFARGDYRAGGFAQHIGDDGLPVKCTVEAE